MDLDDDDRRTLGHIERVGWALICIEPDQEGPGFVYSVGMMHTLDHPEIIMFGLDIDLMASVINGMGEEIRAGRRFDEDGLYDGLLEGCACKCVAVDDRHFPEYFGYAGWHRRYLGKIGTLRAIQCLWPGKVDGLFPDEDGCNEEVARRQPLLTSVAGG